MSAKFMPSCNPIKPALPETLKSDRMVESKSLGCGKLCPRNIAERPSNSQSAGTLLCTNNAAVSRATSSVNCIGESVGGLLLVGVLLVGALLVGALPVGELLGGRLLGGRLLGGGPLVSEPPVVTPLEKGEVFPEPSVNVAVRSGSVRVPVVVAVKVKFCVPVLVGVTVSEPR